MYNSFKGHSDYKVHLGSHEIIENNFIKVLFTQCAIFPFFICAIVAVSLIVVLVVV